MQERKIHFNHLEAEYFQGESDIFNPWDSLVVITSEKIFLIPVGSAGSRDLDTYKLSHKEALACVEKIFTEGSGDMDLILLSAFNSNTRLEDDGLGIDLDQKVTEISIDEFNKLHPDISPKDYIISKSSSNQVK